MPVAPNTATFSKGETLVRPDQFGPTSAVAFAQKCPTCGRLYTGHNWDRPPDCGHDFGRYQVVVVTQAS